MNGNRLAITKKDTDGKTIFDKTHLDWAGPDVKDEAAGKSIVPSFAPQQASPVDGK